MVRFLAHAIDYCFNRIIIYYSVSGKKLPKFFFVISSTKTGAILMKFGIQFPEKFAAESLNVFHRT